MLAAREKALVAQQLESQARRAEEIEENRRKQVDKERVMSMTKEQQAREEELRKRELKLERREEQLAAMEAAEKLASEPPVTAKRMS